VSKQPHEKENACWEKKLGARGKQNVTVADKKEKEKKIGDTMTACTVHVPIALHCMKNADVAVMSKTATPAITAPF
jgi:hypothetical protein